MKKQEIQNKKAKLLSEIKNLDKELNRLHWDTMHSIWQGKLDVVESEIKDMITNKEIRPFLGGPPASAYTHLLKIISEEIFDSRLSIKDSLHVINNYLPAIDGYHSSVDPKNKKIYE